MKVQDINPDDLSMRATPKGLYTSPTVVLTDALGDRTEFIATCIGGIVYLVNKSNGQNWTRPQFIKYYSNEERRGTLSVSFT